MEVEARKTFDLSNNISTINAAELVFLYDRKEEQQLEAQAPWKDDPHYFQTVKISAVALIKMAIHARSGGQYEIMGTMYGKVRDRTFWITDATALPVEGTETRVNAGNEAFEYMVRFQTDSESVGKPELLRGWYHSHPGYGCWLSGVDVNTQLINQTHNDPYLAIVVDPNRTISAGKVEIGAFRCYPEGYVPPAAGSSQYQSIPMEKIEDFGAHANSYYQLNIEIYKSKADERLLDLLWNKYWVATLSQSPLLSNRTYVNSQIKDLTAKIADVGGKLSDSTSELKLKAVDGKKGSEDERPGVEVAQTLLGGPSQDAMRVANEVKNDMTTQMVKSQLFNHEGLIPPEVAIAAAQGRWSAA